MISSEIPAKVLLIIYYLYCLSVCLNQAGIVWGQVDNHKAGKFLAME